MKVSELIEHLNQVENPEETDACLLIRLGDADEEEVMPLNLVEIMENPETGEEMAVLVCDFDESEESDGEDEDDDEESDDEDEDDEDEEE